MGRRLNRESLAACPLAAAPASALVSAPAAAAAARAGDPVNLRVAGQSIRSAFGHLHAPIAAGIDPLRNAPALVASGGVTSCADDGGTDTLRYALITANSGDTITLSGLPCSTIALQKALEVDVPDLTIQGPGAGLLTIDGQNVDRVFLHKGKGTLTLSDVTVAHGKLVAEPAYGGCIRSYGNLTLTRSTVTSCAAVAATKAVGRRSWSTTSCPLDSSTISNSLADARADAPDQDARGAYSG